MTLFEHFSFEQLTTQLAGPVGYAGVFGLLIACGLGVPVPEDIILISGGFIAQAAGNRPWLMMFVGLCGIICGDSVIYFMGRRFGNTFATRSFLKNFITPAGLERVKKLFHAHGEKMIMGARFMPGVRAVTFFTAGTSHVPYYHFVFFDGMAALISAPLWVYLGFRFGAQVVEWAHKFQRGLMLVAAVTLLSIALNRLIALRRRRRKPKPDDPGAGPG